MTTLVALAVVGLAAGACLGAGAAVLAGLGLLRDLVPRERPAWAFAVGFGVFGWLVFLPAAAGALSAGVLLGLGAACWAGTPLLFRAGIVGAQDRASPDGVGWTLIVLIAAVIALDVAEGLAPPADADTLAYHFALPKRFLAAGALEFVPRAVDGATPMIVQMTYVPVLALGGEKALTLWVMLTGWLPAWFVFVLCRRHLGVNWSLAAALVLLTTPAVLYAAGTGQVEIRLALFAIAAAFAAAETWSAGGPRFALLAGLAAGFLAAGKYTGLLFVAATGLVVLRRRPIAHGLCFAAAAAVAGAQWYGWNWAHTGDPVFPLLFPYLGVSDPSLWNQGHDAFFRQMFFASESGVPADPLWFLAYPFKATLDGLAQFESRRTGLGPYVLVLLPFALAGAWTRRTRLAESPLLPVALIAFAFYALWFFTGSSQRVRHLLPVYPLLVVCVTVAAARWGGPAARRAPLLAGAALTIALQTGGQGVFSQKFVRHHLAGESREVFLERNVARYAAAAWINRTLGPGDRIMHGFRQINYLLEVPYYFAHPFFQAAVTLRPGPPDDGRFLRQLRRLKITHILTAPVGGEAAPAEAATGHRLLAQRLYRAGCAEAGPVVPISDIVSRTLPLGRASEGVQVLRLKPGACVP